MKSEDFKTKIHDIIHAVVYFTFGVIMLANIVALTYLYIDYTRGRVEIQKRDAMINALLLTGEVHSFLVRTHSKKGEKQMAYQPTEEDRAWTKQVLSVLKEGGQIIMPGCKSIYTVSHKDKTITRTATMDFLDHHKVLERSKIVFKEFGYEVYDET